MLRTALALACAAVTLPFPLAAQAPADACSLKLEGARGTAAAYGPREDGRRCEGVFVQPVHASTRLFLRGFHLGGPSYDLDASSALAIEVVGPPAAGGLLVARSMRPRHFYQMDTRAVESDGRFLWRTDVLRHPDVRVGPGELAVLYSVESLDDASGLRVWPVRVRGDGGDPVPPIPVVLLESETELGSVIVRVARAETGVSVDQRTIERRFPAGYPIRIRLRVPEAGTYDVSLTAVGPDGARSRTAFTAVVPVVEEEGDQ